MELREKIRGLPKKPGVYLFKNRADNIIYIGKAKSLRARVSSYFTGKPSDPKTARLITKIRDVGYIVVDNEIEALVLEANLVREHRPHYNINLKDDKRFPYIHVTDEPFPRIEVVRRRGRVGRYFGPYTDARAMRSVINLIKEHFRLRSCKHYLPSRAPSRACLNFDMNLCDAPCQGNVSEEEYSERIGEVFLILKGRRRELIKKLKKKMSDAAGKKNFEAAAEFRDRIDAVEMVWQRQKIDTDLADRDLHAVAAGPRNAVAVTMQVREGRVIARQEFHISISPDTTKSGVMSGYLTQYYSENTNPPAEILVSIIPDDCDSIRVFVSERRKKNIELRVPRRGPKHELIKLVERNAELLLAELVQSKDNVRLPFGIIELEKLLKLNRTPRVIEAIDISHLSGTNAVASLVSFRDGKKFGKGYRRFRIKTAEGGDDYASIYEVVHRRIKRLLDDKKALPDLLLIDGGKGQLAMARKAAEEFGVGNRIELASIAKRLEEIFRPGYDKSLMLPRDSAALRLLVRIRDEAHRFAIQYQRQRRTKAFRAQELVSIEGIGPKRQKRLLIEFDSLENIANSEPEVVAEKAAIPIEISRKIIDFLSPYKTAMILVAMGILLFGGCTPSPRYIGNARPATIRRHKPRSVETVADTVRAAEAPATRITRDAPVKRSTAFDQDALLGAVNIYLGTPYRYGGTGFDGIDCSGFVQNAFHQAGVDLPRTSGEQYRVGKSVKRPDFGDLLFFGMSGRSVDHVAIALGNSRFAHASSSLGVTINSLDDPYYKRRFIGARRVY